MAKKRKTRQEKLIANLRRKLATQMPQTAATVSNGLYSLPTTKISPAIVPARSGLSSGQNSHTYVLSDLKKTIVLTGIAFAIQIVLHFTLIK